MHQIKPLAALTPQEVAELAQCAADRGEPLESANPFAGGTSHHAVFDAHFQRRRAELPGVFHVIESIHERSISHSV